MSTIHSRIMISAIAFVFIFITGFLLSRSGKPYGTMIFTGHKLIGLGVGIFLVFIVVQTYRSSGLSLFQMTAILITVILFVATVAAGGILSASNLTPPFLSIIHKVFPYLIILSTSGTLYLLIFHKT